MSWVDAAAYTRRRARSARRRGRRDHRAHERRPRRRAGAVLPALRRARRHARRPSMSAVDRYGFDMVAVSADAPHRGAPRRSPTSAPPVTRCAGRWSTMVGEARAGARLTVRGSAVVDGRPITSAIRTRSPSTARRVAVVARRDRRDHAINESAGRDADPSARSVDARAQRRNRSPGRSEATGSD